MGPNDRTAQWEGELAKLFKNQRDIYIERIELPLDDQSRAEVLCYCSSMLWHNIVIAQSIGNGSNSFKTDVSIPLLSETISKKGYPFYISKSGVLITDINGVLFFAYVSKIETWGHHLIIEPESAYNGASSSIYHLRTEVLYLDASEMLKIMEDFSTLTFNERLINFSADVDRCRKANDILTTHYDSLLKGINHEGIEYNFKRYSDHIVFQFGESCHRKTLYSVCVTIESFCDIITRLREFIADERLRHKFGVRKERCGEYRFLK